MGESDSEKAARIQETRLGNLANSYMPGGDYSYTKRMSEINPYISAALSEMDKGYTGAREFASSQLGSLRGTTGSALVEGGVAEGGMRGSAFLSSISPVIGELSKLLGETSQKKAGIQMTAADFIKTLMLSGDQTISSLLGLQNQAGQGMKKSTLIGDILGVAQTGTNIGAGLFGEKGLFKD